MVFDAHFKFRMGVNCGIYWRCNTGPFPLQHAPHTTCSPAPLTPALALLFCGKEHRRDQVTLALPSLRQGDPSKTVLVVCAQMDSGY